MKGIVIKEVVRKRNDDPWVVYKPENIYHQAIDDQRKVHKGYWRDCQYCMANLDKTKLVDV